MQRLSNRPSFWVSVRSLAKGAVSALDALWESAHHREQYWDLLSYDDRLLDDIGLTRDTLRDEIRRLDRW